MSAEQVVALDGLTKAYGRTMALRDVNLSIDPGEVFGYLGPNGAGKTTTIRLLMGLLRPAVVAYVVNGLGSIVSWLEPVRVLSPFYQYIGHDPLRSGLSVAGIVVALSTCVVLVAIALVGFKRRDIAG